ncbi:hypothetical protein [Microvirga terricola]|uniref:Uncharacterized protein n=1 Tax=Microvirga terricola TaxID=2719797 RepID=A0ABX0VDA8_9HYPH|nr:hypothetical protein [Microvirga terricola]NIX76650.1 hypothetical protein [Microvirga terricola]
MTHFRSHLAAAFAATGIFMAAPALAQSSNCQDAQKFLSERQTLIQQLNSLSGGKNKQVDPRAACAIFTKLTANGDTGMKWIEANKDWCQIPEQFADGFKKDHARSVEMKGKACAIAAKMEQMEKQAKNAQQNGGGGLLGGGGLTGTYTMPKGAL